MSIARVALTAAVSLGLLALACELGLRLAYSEQLKLRQYPLVYQPDAQLGYTYTPDSVGHICVPNICKSFAIDHHGHAFVSARPRASADFSILLVGASNGTGIWLESGNPYADHLEHQLRSGGCDARVINASVDGSNRDNETLRVAYDGLARFSPDVLLLEIEVPFVTMNAMRAPYRGYVLQFPGDIPTGRSQAEKVVDFIESHRVFIWSYQASYVVRGAVRHWLNTSDHWTTYYLDAFVTRTVRGDLRARLSSTWRSLNDLLALRREASAHGASLLLIGENESRLARLAEGHQLDLIRYETPTDPTMRHELDGHWTDSGHRFVANQLYAELRALCDREKNPRAEWQHQ